MKFIEENIGNIIVGAVVFITLALVVIRFVKNVRHGKRGCGCGCDGA
jgi:hypothetical protein